MTVLSVVAQEESGGKLPDKYQKIVDRFPFGEPPEGFDPLSPITSERGGSAASGETEPEIPLSQQQEALQRTVTATAIVFDRVTNAPWLGFSDTTDPKAPRSHYVQLGMSEDGWTVVAIDMEKKTAKLSKGEIEIEVVVGAIPEKAAPQGDARRGALASNAGNAPATGGGFNGGRRFGAPGGRSTLLTGGGMQPGTNPQSGAGGDQPATLQSLRQRRHARETAQLQQLEAERKANQEAVEETRRLLEENERKAQERAERDAQREEYNQRLAAALEEQMAENRRRKAEESARND